MSIEDDLAGFFSEDLDVESVVDNPEKFRAQLKIGSDAFKYLSRAENVGDFTQIAGAGALAGAATSAGWFASLGVLGKVGLGFGLVGTPVGWIALAGVAGVASTYGVKCLFDSAKDASVTEIPKFINTPLDVIGASICELILPILLKISYADGSFCIKERNTIEKYFVEKWGINKSYIIGMISETEVNIDKFSFDNLSTALKEIESTGDCKFDIMSKEILSISKDVLMSDGVAHDSEVLEIKKLEEALSSKDCARRYDIDVLTQATKNAGVHIIDSAEDAKLWASKKYQDINLEDAKSEIVNIANDSSDWLSKKMKNTNKWLSSKNKK